MKDPIYLDHGAATPLDERVLASMQPYLTDQFYNPSATYLAAKAVKRDIEAARARVAHWFGARPSEVVFTAGGTEANNLAIHGVMQQYPEANLVISSIEHDAVRHPAAQYAVKHATVTSDGLIDVDKLIGLIDGKTALISVMYANNEIGTIQPLKQITTRLEAIRKQRRATGNDLPLLLHTDACQASLYLDLHAARLGVDLVTINASKMYGPKQIGALYIRAGVIVTPQIAGGGQERGLRSGTENVAGIIGLAEALDIAQGDRHQEGTRLQALQQLARTLIAEQLPNAVLNGSLKHRLPNNVHLTIPGTDNERLMMALDEQGIMVAVGSACSASSEEPSHVLKAIGLSDSEAQSSLRLTMGRATSETAIQRVISTLAELIPA